MTWWRRHTFWSFCSASDWRTVPAEMEPPSSGGSGFLIDSLLSLRPPCAPPSRAQPPELSPAPPSPWREPGSRPRSFCSSFLIRDILEDCGSCSVPGRVYPDPGHPELEDQAFRTGPDEDFQNRSVSRTPEEQSRGETKKKTENSENTEIIQKSVSVSHETFY